ncbi:MAG: hypothetical protein SWK76_00225 [Actinomycetota bacterium]|nr:hypothetical protein [Actinomycetota bacterium]
MNKAELRERVEEELGEPLADNEYFEHLLLSLETGDRILWNISDFTEDDVRVLLTRHLEIVGAPKASVRKLEVKRAIGPKTQKARYLNEAKCRAFGEDIIKAREALTGREEPFTQRQAEKWFSARAKDKALLRVELLVEDEELARKLMRTKGAIAASATPERLNCRPTVNLDSDRYKTKRMISRLADNTGFGEEELLDLILTDEVPESLIRIEMRIEGFIDRPGRQVPTFRLEGDLRASPSEVEAFYRKRRKRFLEAFGAGVPRALSPRSTHTRTQLLIDFIEGEAAGKTWDERLELWNKRYPDFAYKNRASMMSIYSRLKKRGLKDGNH